MRTTKLKTTKTRTRNLITTTSRGTTAKRTTPKPIIKMTRSFRVLPSVALLHQHFFQPPDFLSPEPLVLQEVKDQLLVRVLKKSAHQVPNLRTRRLFLPNQRRINVRPSIF